MLDSRFVILGVIINLLGAGSYAIDTLRGRAQPNRVSWILWALAPLIAFTAELTKGVGLTSLATLAPGVGPMLVLVASLFNRQSYWRATRFDVICGGLSLLALILWGLTGSGNLAILLSILADGFASVPTLVKAYHEPATESYIAYLACATNGAIGLATIKAWTFASYAFPAYLFVMFIAIAMLIKFPRLRFSPKAAQISP